MSFSTGNWGRMSGAGSGLLAVWVAGAGLAADPKEAPAKPPEPPRVLVVQAPGLEAGALAKLKLRGQFLTNATGVRLTGSLTSVPVTIRNRGEAVKLDGFEPAKVGDQRLEVEFTLPADAALGTNAALVVTAPAGESAPFPLLILPAASVLGEKEPNNGFREAPGAKPPLNLRGALDSGGDVDVFRVDLESGQTLRAEVWAARLGSTLDAMLTLYTSQGAVLASVDDTAGRDPILEYRVTATGDYFLAVSYANEKPAGTHEYLLQLRAP
jgi:hypothetical protein